MQLVCSHHICPGSYRDWHLLAPAGPVAGSSWWAVCGGSAQVSGRWVWPMLADALAWTRGCLVPSPNAALPWPAAASNVLLVPPFVGSVLVPGGAVVLGRCPGGLGLGLPSPWGQEVLFHAPTPHQLLTITNDSD